MAPDLPSPPVALCLGGMDPSGGAGLLRDAATLQAFGVHAMAVSTAETVQNGIACLAIEAPGLDPATRVEALAPHLSGRWGVKLGLWALPLPALDRLAAVLSERGPSIRIWDPVQAPSVGTPLHDAQDLKDMARTLFARGAWVVSPNRLEAAALAGTSTDQDPQRLAAPLLDLGAAAVWLKGGHCAGDRVQDLWIDAHGIHPLDEAARIPGELRGTGCALASAWLALRLLGSEDLEAARQAAAWLRGRWGSSITPGNQGRPVLAPVGAR